MAVERGCPVLIVVDDAAKRLREFADKRAGLSTTNDILAVLDELELVRNIADQVTAAGDALRGRINEALDVIDSPDLDDNEARNKARRILSDENEGKTNDHS